MEQILVNASQQAVEYDDRSTPSYQDELLAELNTRFGFILDGNGKYHSNFIADFFKGDINGVTVLVKVVVGKSMNQAKYEYETLRELAMLADTGTFCVPEPIELLEQRSAYIMRFVVGPLLSRAIVRGNSAESARLFQALRNCGQALGEIHEHWARKDESVDLDEIVAQLCEWAPWRVSDRERRILSGVRRAWGEMPMEATRLYLDFDPVNVLIAEDGCAVLIDPPAEDVTGPLHWDLASFLFGIDRAWWGIPWARPQADRVKRFRYWFLLGYQQGRRLTLHERDLMLVAVCERVRLAQLGLWWATPRVYRNRFKSWARHLYSGPLIRRVQERQLEDLEHLVSRVT